MDLTFSIESSQSVRDLSYLSVRHVFIFSGLSSFVSFPNDLNPGMNGGTYGGRLCYFSRPKLFLS